MRSRVIAAGKCGIYIAVMLFNGWSIERKNLEGNPWPGHPFNVNNNFNSINGDPENTGEGKDAHSLKLSSVLKLQEAYVKKVVDTLNDLDNVLYEISNEDHKDSIDWQFQFIRLIHDYENRKLKQHLIIYSVPWGDETRIWESLSEAVSPGLDRVTGSAYRDDPPANQGNKIIISDTDHLWGMGGDRKWVSLLSSIYISNP